MSYIIAFVSFSKPEQAFPVNCYRTDLNVGDEVIIRRSDGVLRMAAISKIQYLNWECRGRLECKKAEAVITEDGEIILPKIPKAYFGISTSEIFAQSLKRQGWAPLKAKHKMYKAIFAFKNKNSVAYILSRKNGIDIQIVPKKDSVPIKPYSYFESSLSKGKVVRHALAHTTFNLFEGVLRFASSFQNNEKNLDRYFVPQGSTDKRNDQLKLQAREIEYARNEMLDIYEACSGGGDGPAYMGDGLWVSSNGRVNDWGR